MSGRRRNDGYFAVEAAVALALLAMVLGGFLAFGRACGRLNRVELARQQCILAAEAALDSVQATGKGLEEAEIDRCWPGVRVELRIRGGGGAWTGLRRVQAVATTTAQGRDLRVEMVRYVRAQGGD